MGNTLTGHRSDLQAAGSGRAGVSWSRAGPSNPSAKLDRLKPETGQVFDQCQQGLGQRRTEAAATPGRRETAREGEIRREERGGALSAGDVDMEGVLQDGH